MRTKKIVKLVAGTALVLMGTRFGIKLHKIHKLEKESAPEKPWYDKTIKEKEAWLKIHENLASKGDGFKKGIDVLRRDLERQKAGELEEN